MPVFISKMAFGASAGRGTEFKLLSDASFYQESLHKETAREAKRYSIATSVLNNLGLLPFKDCICVVVERVGL